MVLQLITSFLYQLVEQSWLMATILVKYFLFAIGVKIVSEQNFELDYLSNQLIEYSGEIVSLIVALGLINIVTGFEITPLFKSFSQVTAFLYFAFLFWKY